MAFKLGDIVIDRLLYGYAEKISDGTPLYLLTQLSEATINVTAESVDKTDADGNLVKRIWKSKSGTLEATNAFLNSNIMAAGSGSDPIVATTSNGVVMPKIISAVKSTTPLTVADDVVDGSIRVNMLYTDGSLGKAYTVGTSASTTEFVFADGSLTLPTDTEAEQFIIRYNRTVTDGVKIVNDASKFPSSVRLLLKALYYDPCDKGTLKSCIVELPSFQVSPEVSIPISADATMDFNGDLEIDYCSVTKTLYNIYFADDEED